MAALGRRWTWKLWRAMCRRASRRVPSPRTLGGQPAVFLHVLRPSSGEITSCRWCRKAFDVRALGRDLRVDRGGPWADFIETCVNSLHSVSNQFTKGHPLSALASVGDPCRAPSGGPSHPGPPKSCWRSGHLELDGASRGRSQRVDGLIWTFVCVNDEKIFGVDAVVPGHVQSHLSLGNRGETIRPLPPCDKSGANCYVGPLLSQLLMTQSLSDTPRRDVAGRCRIVQEEGRLDHSRSLLAHWPRRCCPRVPSVLHPA